MTLMKRKAMLYVLGLLNGANILPASVVKDAHVEVELVSEVKSVQPGRAFWIGIRLKMEEGWHTYWKNPGDSGLRTRVRWILPKGLHAGGLLWPAPKKFKEDPSVIYGYGGEIFLLTKVRVSKKFHPVKRVQIQARVDWLSCKNVCIPGKATLSLTLPVKDRVPRANIQWSSKIAWTRVRLPVEDSVWQVRATSENKKLILRWASVARWKCRKAEFFPERSDVIVHAAPQELKKVLDGYALRISQSSILNKPIKRLKGVLVLNVEDGDKKDRLVLKVGAKMKAGGR